MLWSPFYVACHLWLRGLDLIGGTSRIGGTWKADGYTYPYQRAVGLATLLYGFVGLVLVYRVLRRYFSRPISLLSTLGICSTTTGGSCCGGAGAPRLASGRRRFAHSV